MGMEVPKVITPNLQTPHAERPVQREHVTQAEIQQTVELSTEDIRIALDALSRAASVFNKRLSFSVNEEIGRVVVKVIDTQSDKVIKEIPPPEMQRLLARLKETVGLIVDEMI